MSNTFQRTVICFLAILVIAGCAAYATNTRGTLDDPSGADRTFSSAMNDGTKQVALPGIEATHENGSGVKGTRAAGTWYADSPATYYQPNDTGVDVQTIDGSFNVTNILTAEGGAIFNEQGGDFDSRFESDTCPCLWFLDAGNSRVGFNTSGPLASVHISASGTAVNPGDNDLIVQDCSTSETAGIHIIGDDGANSQIVFGSDGDTDNGSIVCAGSSGTTSDMTITTEETLIIDAGLALATTDVSGSDTLSVDECVVFLSGTSYTLNLPPASGNAGLMYLLLSRATGDVTLDPYSAETIEGSSTYALKPCVNAHIIVNTAGTGWYVF